MNSFNGMVGSNLGPVRAMVISKMSDDGREASLRIVSLWLTSKGER